MMKQLFCTIVALLIAFVPGVKAQTETAKKPVAVYMTKADDIEEGYKKVINSTIISKLTKSSQFRVLERMDDFLKVIKKDRDYNMSGEVKESNIAAYGKQFGAKYVFVIDPSIIGDEFFISGRMINVELGEVVTSAQEFTSGDESVAKVIAICEKLANSIIGSTGGNSSSSSTIPTPSSGGNVETFTVNGVTFEMVKVDGGSYQMGSYSGDSDEQPVHTETVGTFYIGKTEVTQRQWAAVMGNNPSNFRGENLPVENVSWYDCQEFCERLSRMTGRIFRLPTEAEWEYAARGGNKSHGYIYSGSDDVYRVAWYTENSGGTTHQVAQKLDNELGIYDMSGNVWEWCSDIYSSNYSSPRNSSCRVLRGGSWNLSASSCRVAYRYDNSPGDRGHNLGFRLAL